MGVPKISSLYVLLNTSGTKEQNLKSFSSTKMNVQILKTEAFLCDLRGLRYQRDKIRL